MFIKTKDELECFWNNGVFGELQGVDNIRINYTHFTNTPNSPVIIICPGRCESYLKYKENIFDLYRRGYSVFILDHRGQGLSERMLTNPHKGYVENFDHYAHDLYSFITTIVIPTSKNNAPSILAHSMGSAITIRMLQLYPKVINKAVLLSPMIAINTGIMPKFIARLIVSVVKITNQLLSNEPWYFLGQKNYKAKDFKHNNLTHCKKRYQRFIHLYKNTSNLQLGGVTTYWLHEALKNECDIFSNLHKIETPLCILQASEERIVDNKKQNIFCEKLHKIAPQLITKHPVIIDGASHELLFESDSKRKVVLSKILHFLECSTSE